MVLAFANITTRDMGPELSIYSGGSRAMRDFLRQSPSNLRYSSLKAWITTRI
jgi:hypothetical protein